MALLPHSYLRAHILAFSNFFYGQTEVNHAVALGVVVAIARSFLEEESDVVITGTCHQVDAHASGLMNITTNVIQAMTVVAHCNDASGTGGGNGRNSCLFIKSFLLLEIKK